jgi:hypothetical protein
VAATGCGLVDHQARSVDNYCRLLQLAPALPFIPVPQGCRLADYLACVDRYAGAGVDLRAAPLSGLGSVCRWQASIEIAATVGELAGLGLRLHGFGAKTRGLADHADGPARADLLAWSYAVRHRPPLPGCASHRNRANCPRYALARRSRLVCVLDGPEQLRLGGMV